MDKWREDSAFLCRCGFSDFHLFAVQLWFQRLNPRATEWTQESQILSQGQCIIRAEVVGEGWGLEIVLWRGSALYPAGVWICVHKHVCVWMFVCVFMWVTMYMCEGVCVCVCECLYVYYWIRESVCICVSVCLWMFIWLLLNMWVRVYMCVCECLYGYYWMYESMCVCVSVCVEWRISLSLSQKPKEMWQGAWRPQHVPDSSAEVSQVPSCDSAIWLTIAFTLHLPLVTDPSYFSMTYFILSIFHEDTTFSDPLETKAWKW